MSTEATCGKNEPRVAPKRFSIPVSRRAYAVLIVPLAAGLCALPSFVSAYAATLAVEVRCPSGHVVTVPAADAAMLRQLFAALAPVPPC